MFDETQIFRIDHFLGKEAALNILAFRFANGLFEPIWHRNFIDHVQIDIPEKLGLEGRAAFYETTGAYRDMVVTHLFQVMAFTAMEPPVALDPESITEEKLKVFRSMLPIDPHDVVRGQYAGYTSEKGVDPDSETETFIALKCYVDNWRWADVPFYLRTGKNLAEGQRIISIAFKEPPRSMFPEESGVGEHGPDHLTFDLADRSKMSLSFYGKRPGPGFRLNKLSMQFDMGDTGWAGSALEAYERLILDAVKGNHTLFNSAAGLERLWEISAAAARAPAAGAVLRPRVVGAEPDPPAGRAVLLAAAVRAEVARLALSVEIFQPVAESYAAFAVEAVDSPCFRDWATSVAGDAEVQALIATLPPIKQQANLVFAAARWHGVPAPGPYAALRAALLDDWDTIRGTVMARSTQTNEVGRLATLVPVFAGLDGPLALIEVGASAGLCLYPDRWGYAWTFPGRADGHRRAGAAAGVRGHRGAAAAGGAARGGLAGRHRPAPAGRHRPGRDGVAADPGLARAGGPA